MGSSGQQWAVWVPGSLGRSLQSLGKSAGFIALGAWGPDGSFRSVKGFFLVEKDVRRDFIPHAIL